MARRRARTARRTMMRLFVIGLVALGLLADGLFIASRLLSPRFIGDQIVAAVARETGRRLSFSGQPRITFWPRLSVRLRDVVLSNPPRMGAGAFLKVGEVELSVAARPLLQRRLEVKKVLLKRPRINLLVDARGRQNWDFSRPAPSAGSGKAGAGVAPDGASGEGPGGGADAIGGLLADIRIAPILIEDGRLSWLDERSGSAFSAEAVNLRITLPRPDAPLAVKGSAVWRSRPVRLALFIKSPRRLAGPGSPIEVSLEAPALKAAYSGLAALGDGPELAGRIEASSPSLRELMAWLGVAMPPGRGLGAFSARAALGLKGGELSLKKARLGLDGMAAQGDLRIITTGPRPRIIASLGMDRIDINPYLAPRKSGGGGGISEWSDAPVDFSALKALDADLRLNVNEILYRKVRIGRSLVSARLKKGVLDATLERMAFYDGQAKGRIVLDGTARPALRGSLRAEGLNGERLLKDFADIEAIRGTLSLDLALSTSGASQQEMVSRLGGKAALRFSNGAIRGINLARLVRTVKTAIVEGWKKAPRQSTDFAELSASFTITDGLAKTTDLKLIGPLVRVTGAGEADLLRRKLDFRVEPRLVGSIKGQGGRFDLSGLPVPVIIRGPWDNPKIYPDVEGILKDPDKAFKTIQGLMKAGPAGFLKAMEKARRKAGSAARVNEEKLKGKASRELGKVIGEDKAQKAVEKGSRKMRKLLRGIFGRKKPPQQQPQPQQAQ